MHTYGVNPARLVVVSRSERRAWYGSLAGRFLDAKDLFRGGEFDEGLRRTIPQSQQNPKQAVMYPFDQEILQRAASVLDFADYQTVHPLMFFRVLQRLKADRQIDRLPDVLAYERIVIASGPPGATTPKPFVAVSAGHTEALPGTAGLGELQNVAMSAIAGNSRAMPVEGLDLSAQLTASRAAAFVGPYGDLAVLAASCGVPVTAFHSAPLPVEQTNLLRLLGASGVWGPTTIRRIEEPKGSPPQPAGAA
jgi:hypothetical protein